LNSENTNDYKHYREIGQTNSS
jgi:hypothetical protein